MVNSWLRWYHGTVNDPKFRVIAKKTGASVAVVVVIWAAMLENASESSNRGTLEGFDPESLAETLGETTVTVVTVCNGLREKMLSGDTLINWEKRNAKRERDDDSTERVQRFRERQRNETPRNAKKHLDKKREDKKRKGNLQSAVADEKDFSDRRNATFEQLWARYPAKDGRKHAERHFSASVKTEQDLTDAAIALDNYLAHLKSNDWKRPKNGATWFNGWRDWIDWQEPAAGNQPGFASAGMSADERAEYNRRVEAALDGRTL